MRDMHTYSLNSWQLKSRAHILCSPLLSYFHRCTYTYTHIFTVALAPKDKVSPGEGCDGEPMWARRPWTGLGGSGFSYGLIIMSEGVGLGVKAMVVIRGCYACVGVRRASVDNSLA